MRIQGKGTLAFVALSDGTKASSNIFFIIPDGDNERNRWLSTTAEQFFKLNNPVPVIQKHIEKDRPRSIVICRLFQSPSTA